MALARMVTSSRSGADRLRHQKVPEASPDERETATLVSVGMARRELGMLLAQWREQAGLRQEDLARRTHYVRSTIAGVETGRQATPRAFWERADAELDAGGALVKAFEQVERLVDEARRRRQEGRRRARYQALVAELRRYADLVSDGGCPYGCAMQARAVACWTGQQVRWMREACRLTTAEFAARMGVTAGAVAGWQRRVGALPLPVQRRLDEWLHRAETEIQARFWLLVDAAAGAPAVAADVRPDRARAAEHAS